MSDFKETQHGRNHRPGGSDPITGIGGLQYHEGTYGPLNVGDYLDVVATERSPDDPRVPVRFDVSANGIDNDWGATAQGVGLGGFYVQVISDFVAPTLIGHTVDIEIASLGATVDGSSIWIHDHSFGDNMVGGTITGRNDQIDGTSGTITGSRGYYRASDDHSDVLGTDLTVIGQESSTIAGLKAQATGGDVSNVYGAKVTATAAGASAFAFGVYSTVSGTSGATAYSGWFEGGSFAAQLPAGKTFTLLDSTGNPKIRWTEGTNDLHIPTGGTIVADL